MNEKRSNREKSGSALASGVRPKRAWKLLIKVVPWFSLFVAAIAAYTSRSQFKLQERAADRIWKAQLIATLFDTDRCEDAKIPPHCLPKASLQSRAEALKEYLQLEREYKNEVKLQDVDLSLVNLEEEDLDHITLRGADLKGISLGGSKLHHVTFFDVHLEKAHLEDAHLEDSVINVAALQGAHLRGARLNRSVLTRVKFGSCDYHQSDFGDLQIHEETDLSDAHLEGAIFTGSSFCGTTIRGSDVRGADLSKAIDLTQKQLESAKGDDMTKIPATLQRPLNWTYLWPHLGS